MGIGHGKRSSLSSAPLQFGFQAHNGHAPFPAGRCSRSAGVTVSLSNCSGHRSASPKFIYGVLPSCSLPPFLFFDIIYQTNKIQIFSRQKHKILSWRIGLQLLLKC